MNSAKNKLAFLVFFDKDFSQNGVKLLRAGILPF